MLRSFPTKKSLQRQAVLFIFLFLAWSGFAAWAMMTDEHRLALAAILLTVGVPAGMCCLSVYLYVQTQIVLAVSDEGFQLKGPFGTQWTPWSVIRYADIQGSDDSGLKLFDVTGKAVTVDFKQFENGDQLPSIFLPKVRFDDGEEPLIAQHSGRLTVLLITLGTLGLFIPATISIGPRGAHIWPFVFLLAILLAPVSALVWTFRISLTGNVLTSSSCFGSQTLTISSETQVQQGLITTKNGTFEKLKLTNPNQKPITLFGKFSRYAAFRVRILALIGDSRSD